MERSINKVTLLGRLGADPEIRYTQNGTPVGYANLATSFTIKDNQTGNPIEITEWHKLIFFNRYAEIAQQYLHKGSKIHIEGRLQTRKWEKNGVERWTTEIIVNDLIMLDGKKQTNEAPVHEPAYEVDDDVLF